MKNLPIFSSIRLFAVLVFLVSCHPMALTFGTSTVPPSGPGGGHVDNAQKPLLGINLRFASWDSDEDRMFTDMVKTARSWWAGTTLSGTLVAAQADQNGWPLEDACLVIADGQKLEGTYACRFNGKADVIWGYGALGTIDNMQYTGNTSTFTITITSSGAWGLVFSNTVNQDSSTGKGISNLQIMRPVTWKSTQSYPFDSPTQVGLSDQVKAEVAPFQVIRFMDYLSTNSNPIQHWSDRLLPTYYSQNPSSSQLAGPSIGGDTSLNPTGGCYEFAIALCNATQKDLWLNVPLFADNDYVNQLAALVRNQLNPSLNVYVEYSNEIWNTAPAFLQGNENHNLAINDVNIGVQPPLNPPFDSSSTWDWANRRVARRLVEISNIFRTVFGDAAMPGNGNTAPRVRPVLEWQQGSGATDGLMFIEQNYPNPVNYYLYGTGGSAYYNPTDASSDSSSLTTGTMNWQNWLSTCETESVVAHAFGLKRIAYEGGPSFDAESAGEGLAWGESQMTTNMVDHYNQAWAATDSDLLTYYATVGDVAWGFTQDAFNLNTPKYNAITQLTSLPKAPVTFAPVAPHTWPGDAANGYGSTVPDYSADTFSGGAYGYSNADGTFNSHPANSAVVPNFRYLAYSFLVTTAGTYTLNLNVSVSSSDPTTGGGQAFCDGVSVGSIPRTISGALAAPLSLGKLGPGVHAVLLKFVSMDFNIHTVTVAQGS